MASINKIKLNVDVQSIFKTETSSLDSTISGLQKSLNKMGKNAGAKKSVEELKKGYEDVKKIIESSGVIGGDTKSEDFFGKAEGASKSVDKALKMASIIIEKINSEISEMKKNMKDFSAETEKLENLKSKQPKTRIEASAQEIALNRMNTNLNRNKLYDSMKNKINVGTAAESSGITKDYDFSKIQAGDEQGYKTDSVYLALDQLAKVLKAKSDEIENETSAISKKPASEKTEADKKKLRSLRAELKVEKSKRNEIMEQRKEVRDIYKLGIKNLDNTKEYDAYARKIAEVESKIKSTGVQNLDTAKADIVQQKLALKYAEGQEKINKKITSENLKKTASSGKYTKEVKKQNSGLKASRSLISDLVVKQITMQKVIQSVQRIWSAVIQTIGQLDKSLTDITVVTSMNRAQVYGLLGDYQALAKNVGLTTTEVVDLSTQFYRQGKTTEEAFKLTETAAKLARIASIDATDAADYLTSALNGFGLSAEKAVDVTDKLANLSATSASSVEELAKALQKVAPSAATAGVSIDNMMGFIAKGIETTREAPENIGTAFKTIFARMSQLKDLGSTVEDGMSLSSVDKALSDVGITLRDTMNGGFRPLDEVLIDLGNSWSELDSYEKAYVGTALAGTRQQSRLQAVMNDFPRTLELIEKSQNSSGIAALQHTQYMKGLEASLTNLKTTWQTFVTSITSSEAIVFIIQSLTSAFSGLVVVLDSGIGKLLAGLLVFKGLRAGGNKLLTTVKSLGDAFNTVDHIKFDKLTRFEKAIGKFAGTSSSSENVSIKELLSSLREKYTIKGKIHGIEIGQLKTKEKSIKKLNKEKVLRLAVLGIAIATVALFKKISDAEPETKQLAEWQLALKDIQNLLKGILDKFSILTDLVSDFSDKIGELPVIIGAIVIAIGTLIIAVIALKAAVLPVYAIISAVVAGLSVLALTVAKGIQGTAKKAQAAILATTNSVKTLNSSIQKTSDLLNEVSKKWDTYNKLRSKAYLTDAEKSDFADAQEYFNNLAKSGKIENNWQVNDTTITSYLGDIQKKLDENNTDRHDQLEKLFKDSDFNNLTPSEIAKQINKSQSLDSSEKSSMLATAKASRTAKYMEDTGITQSVANSVYDYNLEKGGEIGNNSLKIAKFSFNEIKSLTDKLEKEKYKSEDIANAVSNKISSQLNSKDLSSTNKQILSALYKSYDNQTRTAVIIKELSDQYGDGDSESYTKVQRGMISQGQQAIQDWLSSQSSLADEEKARLKDKYLSNLMNSVASSSGTSTAEKGLIDSGTAYGDKEYAKAINFKRVDVTFKETTASLKEFGSQYTDIAKIISDEDFSVTAVEKMKDYLEGSPELFSKWMRGTLKASEVINAKYDEMEQGIEDTIQAQSAAGASEETLNGLKEMLILTKELGKEEIKRADANQEVTDFYNKSTEAIQNQINALDEEASSLEQIGRIQALNEKSRGLSKLDLSTSIDSQAAKKQMAAEVNDLQKQMEIDIKKINLEAQKSLLEDAKDKALLKSQDALTDAIKKNTKALDIKSTANGALVNENGDDSVLAG